MEITKIQELVKECRDIENIESLFRGNFLTDLDLVEKELEQLRLHGVSSMFKGKLKIEIEVLEGQYKELRNDTRASFEDDDWGIRLTAIRAKIEALTSALNYC